MFRGVYTAIITPFKNNGEIDWEAFEKLIEIQIKAKVAGIVPVGTTGESPTLPMNEHKNVIRFSVERVNKRIQVIAGTGGNSTEEACELTKYAKEIGCDGVLLVCPYYNKPTNKGLYKHFKAINDCVDIPMILYNVPGRSSKNIEVSTIKKLALLDNIVAVKEASGNINQMMEILYECPADFTVLSGDDSITLPLIAAGGKGLISVLSNLEPKKMVNMVEHALNGDFTRACKLHYDLWPLFKAEFLETNPIPIKYMLAKRGLIEEVYRLPMCPLEESTKKKIDAVLEEMNN